jgi:hypothetical protein
MGWNLPQYHEWRWALNKEEGWGYEVHRREWLYDRHSLSYTKCRAIWFSIIKSLFLRVSSPRCAQNTPSLPQSLSLRALSLSLCSLFLYALSLYLCPLSFSLRPLSGLFSHSLSHGLSLSLIFYHGLEFKEFFHLHFGPLSMGLQGAVKGSL